VLYLSLGYSKNIYELQSAGQNICRSKNAGGAAAGQLMEDKIVFSLPRFEIVARTIEGSNSPYYLLRTADYVSILALTTEGSLLLVWQQRPAVETETLELPSGHVKQRESPETAARRELAEETGYEARRFELFGMLAPDTGRLANNLWCFFVSDATLLQPHVKPEVGKTASILGFSCSRS
jgi:NUDIX domain